MVMVEMQVTFARWLSTDRTNVSLTDPLGFHPLERHAILQTPRNSEAVLWIGAIPFLLVSQPSLAISLIVACRPIHARTANTVTSIQTPFMSVEINARFLNTATRTDLGSITTHSEGNIRIRSRHTARGTSVAGLAASR